jgi:hypothetical protein
MVSPTRQVPGTPVVVGTPPAVVVGNTRPTVVVVQQPATPVVVVQRPAPSVIPVVTPGSNPTINGRMVKCMHVRGPHPCPACARTVTVQGRVLPGTRK